MVTFYSPMTQESYCYNACLFHYKHRARVGGFFALNNFRQVDISVYKYLKASPVIIGLEEMELAVNEVAAIPWYFQ